MWRGGGTPGGVGVWDPPPRWMPPFCPSLHPRGDPKIWLSLLGRSKCISFLKHYSWDQLLFSAGYPSHTTGGNTADRMIFTSKPDCDVPMDFLFCPWAACLGLEAWEPGGMGRRVGAGWPRGVAGATRADGGRAGAGAARPAARGIRWPARAGGVPPAGGGGRVGRRGARRPGPGWAAAGARGSPGRCPAGGTPGAGGGADSGGNLPDFLRAWGGGGGDRGTPGGFGPGDVRKTEEVARKVELKVEKGGWKIRES
jgi:hypothetical protein